MGGMDTHDTPADELLLQLLREGRVPAEIAVRLGISTGDVHARIEHLAHARGVSRGALRTPEAEVREVETEPEPQPGGRARAPAWLAAGFVLGALLSGLAVYALTGNSQNVAASPSPPATTFASPTSRPAPTPTALPTLPANGPVSIGKVFTVPYTGGAVQNVSRRAAFTAVTLLGAGLVQPQSANVSLSVQNFGVDVVFATATFHVRMEPGEHTKWVPGSSDSFAVYSDDSSQPPQLLLFVTDGDGATHAADVTPDGRILIDLAPIPKSAVVALPTGEALDVSRGTNLGQLSANTPGGLYTGTICQTLDVTPPTSCIAQVTTSQPLLSPVNGTASCDGGFVHLAGPAATLVFRIERAGSFGETAPCVGPTGRQVLAGDPIEADLIGSIEITATDPAGSSIPVVMAGDGTLYAGDIHPTVGCPCGGLN